MTLFVESVDVDAAWEVHYQLADRRHKDGLTFEELRQVIEAALVGVVEAEMDKALNGQIEECEAQRREACSAQCSCAHEWPEGEVFSWYT